MTIKELVEYHAALIMDRQRLHDMRASDTYKLDEILRDVQVALRDAIAAESGEDNRVVAELRRKIAELEAEACLYYNADGTTEKLFSPYSVTERRKKDARDLVLQRAELVDLRARLAASEPPPMTETERAGIAGTVLTGAMADETPEKVPGEDADATPPPKPDEIPW